jgi:ubiquitin thioesterase protein OTUB1
MGDLKGYCSLNIEPSLCEIDYVAVGALSAALIKPAGFGFEVMYLDRSPGDEVNIQPFSEPTDHNGMLLSNPPTIRLLYRP